MSQDRILIVGAGVAGLVAALRIENEGFHPILIERDSQPGGRMQSEEKDGFILDRGFQVLLTAYGTVAKYLNTEALQLQRFDPGARVFTGKGDYLLSDPLRDPAQALSMLLSGIGTLRDKWLLAKLLWALRGKDGNQVFDGLALPTREYLREYGFSKGIIARFFRPFFSGIFLEDALDTPASLFRFVLGKFSEGYAAVPANGIRAVPTQLLRKLRHTEIRCSAAVRQILPGKAVLESGEIIPFDRLLLANEGRGMATFFPLPPPIPWNGHVQWYFTTDRPLLGRKIGLFADPASPLSNIAAISELKGGPNDRGEWLLSVSLKAGSSKLESPPIATIRQLLDMPNLPLNPLARYVIPRALPVCSTLRHTLPAAAFQVAGQVWQAGDFLLHPSLDGAMRSGEQAAEALLASLA